MVVFGITVAWSIYTTGKKARQLLAKEKEQRERAEGKQVGPTETTELAPVAAEETTFTEPALDGDAEGHEESVDAAALEEIYYNESHHFTMKRMGFYFINFIILLVTQTIVKNPKNSLKMRGITMFVFAALMGVATQMSISEIDNHTRIKRRLKYVYDKNDLRFKDRVAIIQLSMACMVAAILCGMTGIAGGMVLGPLFLRYNMVPTVMSATN